MSGYFITISEWVSWEKLSNRWYSKRKDAWGYFFFGSLIRLLRVIWSSWKHSANTNSIVFQCLNVKIGWKQYCAKALTTVILESALSGNYQSCTSKQSSFLVLLTCSNASQTEFLLVDSHVKGFTALRWYIPFYMRPTLIFSNIQKAECFKSNIFRPSAGEKFAPSFPNSLLYQPWEI